MRFDVQFNKSNQLSRKSMVDFDIFQRWFREFETLFPDQRRTIQSFFWIKDFN